MRSPGETAACNRLLGQLGMATLEDPRGLLNQVAYLIGDEDTFRRLLMKLDPPQRRDCYESLKARLPFEAKPLEHYINQAKETAEHLQLPTYNPETGQLTAYKPAEITVDPVKAAEAAIAEMNSKQKLWLVCSKCTREQVFHGETQVDAIIAARKVGWYYDRELDREICPKCPAPRPELVKVQ